MTTERLFFLAVVDTGPVLLVLAIAATHRETRRVRSVKTLLEVVVSVAVTDLLQ